MRTALLLALAALIAFAPTALAQNETGAACPDGYVDNGDGTCSRQAWVDDCPPDMMCAAGGNASDEPIPYGNESCIECSGPVDGAPRDNATYDGNCGGEVCAYDGGVGPDGCIDCMKPDQGTCMDGADANETCRDDVQYLDGRGPADCENCRGEDAGPIDSHTDTADEKNVPGFEAVLVAVALAGAVFVALRRR